MPDADPQRRRRRDAIPRRSRAQRVATSIALVTVAIGSLLAVAVAWQRSEDEVVDRAERAARRTAVAVDAQLVRTAARLAGAPALLVDADDGSGAALAARAEAFLGDVLDPDAAPDAVVLRLDPEGATVLATASSRDGARPRPGLPLDRTNPLVVAALGAEGDEVAVSREVDLPGWEPGIALVRRLGPADGPGGDLAVALAVPTRALEPVVDDAVPVVLLDGDDVLLGDPAGRRGSTAEAAATVLGRRLVVVALADGGPDRTLVLLTAVGGLLTTGSLGLLVLLGAAHQRRLRVALDRAETSEARIRAVQALTARLVRGLSVGEVVDALTTHLPDAVGAVRGVVALRDEDGVLVEGRPDLDAPDEEAARTEVPVVAGGPLARALLRREPSWMPSPFEWRDDPGTGLLAGDAASLALVPLGGGVDGVLAVGYANLRFFDDEERRLLRAVGTMAGRALARGRRYDTDRQVAEAFQAAALPDRLPEIDGLDVVARYRPAAEGVEVGGDWYDVRAMGDGRVLLVVGDVVGHGVAAAATMGALRAAFAVVAAASGDPGEVLATMDQRTDAIRGAFCTTTVCATVSADRTRLLWSRAGHPPPVLVTRGRARLLDQRGLAPLGVAPGLDPPVHEVALHSGDLLLAYTDGLVERRGEDVDVGFERLRATVESLAGVEDLDRLVDRVLRAQVGGDQADDVALIAVRVR